MLTAFSRMIGLSRDDSSLQSTVALQNQINDLERGATTKEISQKIKRRTGMSATFGAVAGGGIGYCFSTLSVAVAAVAAPVTAAAAGAAAGALVLGAGYNWYAGSPKSNHQNTVKKINAISKNLVDSKIKALAEAKAGASIDFNLNRTSKVEEEESDTADKKPVGLVKLDKLLVRKLLSSLKSISKLSPRVKIKKIDISSAGLTRRDMTNLLSAGLGNHETEHLILSNDNHSEAMIKLLKVYIVDRKVAFQNLKKLDLHGNAISESSLNDIREIVNYLRLKELNISDNPDLAEKALEEVKGRISLILTDERNRLVSLRKLNLANTGIVEDQAEDIAKFIEQAVFLEELNIDRNDGLNLDVVKSQVKEKGAVKSVSLQELVTEYDDHLDMEEVFSERDDILQKLTPAKKSAESWPIYLLNYKLTHKSFPAEVTKYLEGTAFNKIKIEELIAKIQRQRSQHLGVQTKSTTVITESELIACYEDKLADLYQKVKNKTGAKLVDDKLVGQIDISKRNLRTKPAERPSGPLRTKPTMVKMSRGKVAPTPTKPKEPAIVKLPAPLTTQFNAARTAKLHAEINATLNAEELARNPALATSRL